MELYQTLLCRLLDEEPLKSTWFYQDKTIAAIEQAVFERMCFDELFDAEDVYRTLRRQNDVVTLDKIIQQMGYMGLGRAEERLIFREVTYALYEMFRQAEQTALVDGLHAISSQNDARGKVVRFAKGYVYVPKFVLLLLINDYDQFDGAQREKIQRMKPKFAKYFFNCCLESLTDMPEEQCDLNKTAREKRLIYGRIKG